MEASWEISPSSGRSGRMVEVLVIMRGGGGIEGVTKFSLGRGVKLDWKGSKFIAIVSPFGTDIARKALLGLG